NMVHIQYRGNGPALIDLLAGQVQVGFDTMPASIEYIRAGKLRALAVCTVTRSDALPDLPTVAEFVPGYEPSGYFGFGAPAKTPAEIVDKLNQEINAGLADPKLKARLAVREMRTAKLRSFPRKREPRPRTWAPATGSPPRERRGVPLAGTRREGWFLP